MPRTRGKDTSTRDALLILTLVLAAIGLIIYMATSSKPDGTGSTQPTQRSESSVQQHNPAAELARREPDDPLALGDVDAPVTMVMYSDYRCPFCAKFSRDTEPHLVERYVDRGVLRIEWRDFPIFGDQSMAAARAGRAAAEQGKFWEFNRTLYEDAPPTGHPDLTPDKLRSYAREAGLPDMKTFNARMNDHSFDDDIRADLSEGSSIGVTSTPAFIINGQPVLGAQPLDTFTTMIDRAAEGA